MAQTLQPWGYESAAKETLPLANDAAGIPGMNNTTSPVGVERGAGDMIPRPESTTMAQLEQQQYQRLQHEKQNQLDTRVPQMQAAAAGQVRKGVASGANAQEYAQRAKSTALMALLEDQSEASATWKLGFQDVADTANRHAQEQAYILKNTNPQLGPVSSRVAV